MHRKILKYGRFVAAVACLTAFGAAAHAEFKLSDVGDKLTLSGQVRVRPEFRRNLTQAYPAVPGAREEDFSTLLRSRLGLRFDPTDHLRFLIQIQDSRDFGEEAAANALPAGDDEGVDLHQGYIEYANVGDSGFSFRIGRQELVFGSQRLVGNGDWFQVGRAFDGGLAMYDDENWTVSAFATQANKTLAGDQTLFGGIYNTWKGVPSGVLDFYYMLLQDNDGAAGAAAGTGNTQSVHTAGVRVKSDPGRWDLSAEIAAQLGKFGSNSILAYAGHAWAGYTFEETYKPKLLVEYNYASGDDGGNNRYSKFNNLFPTNHNKYGYMDLVAWSNIHDGRAEFSVMPGKNWKLSADYHLFMVDKTGAGDTFAGVAGAAGAGKLAGHEGDITVGYNWNQYANFQLGFSHFIPGAFLKNQGITASSDFGYFQAVANF